MYIRLHIFTCTFSQKRPVRLVGHRSRHTPCAVRGSQNAAGILRMLSAGTRDAECASPTLRYGTWNVPTTVAGTFRMPSARIGEIHEPPPPRRPLRSAPHARFDLLCAFAALRGTFPNCRRKLLPASFDGPSAKIILKKPQNRRKNDPSR
jgi:hypothetical protein